MSMDAESRYAHLLQPIRDLTKNWEVDVASHLEGYLDELDQICISFDNGKTSMNFSEAALLIQGSACVYSKKVEHLYTLVYQALDLISNQKRCKQPTSVGQDGLDNNATLNKSDKVEFLSLDDLSETGRPHVYLREDGHVGVQVACLTPAALITVEEHEKKKYPLHSCNGEVLASLKDFCMNTMIPDAYGILCVNPTACETLYELHKPAKSPIGPPDDDDEAPDLGEIADDDFVGAAHAEDGDQVCPSPENQTRLRKSGTHVERLQALVGKEMIMERPGQKEHEPCEDPWRWMDPFAPSEDKPLKPGKHYHIPASVQAASEKKRKRRGTPELRDFFNWFKTTGCNRATSTWKGGPTCGDLEELYLNHRKKVQKSYKGFARKARLPCDVLVEAEQDLLQDCDSAGDDSPEENEENLCPLAMLEEQDIVPAFERERVANEDLVSRNVEQFLVISQKYAQETKLSQQLKHWEEKLGPHLNVQEEREAFNIHTFETHVMNGFGSVGQRRSFAHIVQGKESHEVCRYLLASLQLANDCVVEIHQREGIEEALDTMELTLLSKKLPHDRFKTYKAPSVTGSH